MDPVLQRYLSDFRKQHELEHLKPEPLFETFATFCVVSRLHEAHFRPDPLRTGGVGDQGVDGFAILINGEMCIDQSQVTDALDLAVAPPRIQVIVVQAKTTPGFESKVFKELANTIEHLFTAPQLREGCSAKIQNVRHCVERLYRDKRKIAGHLPALYVWYVTPGKPLPRRLDPKRLEAEQTLSGLTGEFSSVQVRAVGVTELRQLYKKATEALSATLTIPRQRRAELPNTPGVTKGVLGTVSARDLVENLLRDESKALRTVLFDDNVRDFLGATDKSVNAEIKETLEDADARHRFAILNNGITIVAKSVDLVKDAVVLADPRIVNGCQTSNVLFDAHAREKLDDEVMVAVRIFESTKDEILESIVLATNRQTAIDMNDVMVRGALHREVEQYFVAQPPARRLYYERRPGQYRRLDINQTRVLTRLDLARAYAATFLGDNWQLWRVSDLTEERARKIFDPDNDPLLYYIAASVHYRLDWLFRNRHAKFGEFKPARYVMMRTLSLTLLGSDGLPRGRVERKVAANALIDTLWTEATAESAVDAVVPALRAAVDAVKVAGGSLSEAARTQDFADKVCSLVLGRS